MESDFDLRIFDDLGNSYLVKVGIDVINVEALGSILFCELRQDIEWREVWVLVICFVGRLHVSLSLWFPV